MTTAEHVPEHEYVVSWHPSDTAKAILALFGTVLVSLVAVAQTVAAGGWSVGSLTMAAVSLLLPVTTYAGGYHAKWFLSAKTYLNAAVVALTALAPVVMTYWTGNGWHNLTGTQWLGFVMAAAAALGAGIVPNSETARTPAGWGPTGPEKV